MFTMNTYELTVITADKASGEKIEKTVKDWVKKVKGEVVKVDVWGEKTLAYPIKKNKIGYYTYLVLQLVSEEQPKLDKMMRLEEQLLRYLFVKVG